MIPSATRIPRSRRDEAESARLSLRSGQQVGRANIDQGTGGKGEQQSEQWRTNLTDFSTRAISQARPRMRLAAALTTYGHRNRTDEAIKDAGFLDGIRR